MKTLNRPATMIPKDLQIRFKENSASIKYDVQDDATQLSAGELWVNFKPSEKLLKLLLSEIDKAICDRWQNEKAYEFVRHFRNVL